MILFFVSALRGVQNYARYDFIFRNKFRPTFVVSRSVLVFDWSKSVLTNGGGSCGNQFRPWSRTCFDGRRILIFVFPSQLERYKRSASLDRGRFIILIHPTACLCVFNPEDVRVFFLRIDFRVSRRTSVLTFVISAPNPRSVLRLLLNWPAAAPLPFFFFFLLLV